LNFEETCIFFRALHTSAYIAELSSDLFSQATEWMEFGTLTVLQSLQCNFSPNTGDLTIRGFY
jgi:hypothetical protein